MPISDAHLFSCIVTIAVTEAERPLTQALGLTRAALAAMYARTFGTGLPTLDVGAGPGEDALEEPDLRDFLLECRAGHGDPEVWLAAIIARRSLRPNHLWQDLGFTDRRSLTLLLGRHFPELVRRNATDMKWKKFFYRQLCARDGIPLCKAPNCAVCPDAALCFGPETGEPLLGRVRSGAGDRASVV